jgi:protein-disulfide isomerase
VRRIHRSPSLPPQAGASRSRWWRVRMWDIGILVLGWSAAIPLEAFAQADGVAARTKGRPDAPVVIYEMSDFECPYCRDFTLQTMPSVEREFIRTGKVRLTFINLPLTGVHRHAMAAAEVAMCAARQGKFWQVHDRLYQRQSQWAARQDANPYLLALADSAGVNHARLAACLSRGLTRPAIEADTVAAHRAGAHTTPTFFIEGGIIEGAAPFEVFREVLDSVYRSKTAAVH